ncbi:hypothetical protein BC829DRAFT_444136 [Chytridium lagenaria]|nr:hypothetical protein BC829DRAFT_444136 [Chytridium lagenaria]
MASLLPLLFILAILLHSQSTIVDAAYLNESEYIALNALDPESKDFAYNATSIPELMQDQRAFRSSLSKRSDRQFYDFYWKVESGDRLRAVATLTSLDSDLDRAWLGIGFGNTMLNANFIICHLNQNGPSVRIHRHSEVDGYYASRSQEDSTPVERLKRGVGAVDWRKGTLVPGTVSSFAMKQAHGFGMAVVWLVVFPAMIFYSRFFRSTPNWIRVHYTVQSAGAHAFVGIFLVIGSVAQVALGLSILYPWVEPRGREFWYMYMIVVALWIIAFVASEIYFARRRPSKVFGKSPHRGDIQKGPPPIPGAVLEKLEAAQISKKDANSLAVKTFSWADIAAGDRALPDVSLAQQPRATRTNRPLSLPIDMSDTYQHSLTENDWRLLHRARRRNVHSYAAIQRLASYLVGELNDAENSPDEYRRYAITAKEMVSSGSGGWMRETSGGPIFLLRFCLLHPTPENFVEPLFVPGDTVEVQARVGGRPVAFEVLVRVKPGGLMSSWLAQQKPGERQVKIRGPVGRRWLNPSMTHQLPPSPTHQPLLSIASYDPSTSDELELPLTSLPTRIRITVLASIRSASDASGTDVFRAAELSYPDHMMCICGWFKVSAALDEGG